MMTETIEVVGRIERDEIDRLYFLAGRDGDRCHRECAILFGVKGMDSALAEFTVHPPTGITMCGRDGSVRQILRPSC